MNEAASGSDYQLPAGYGAAIFATIDSTNDEARRRAGEGLRGPTWFIAQRQTAGRGRRGRAWVSEAGNLHTSLLLRPESSAGEAARLSFAAALAVAEAIDEVTGVTRRVMCKWPNDVLFGSRKVSGILLESASTASGALDWLVIGIGVNVTNFPADTEYPATSLLAEGFAQVSAPALFAALARRMDAWLATWRGAGFAPIREAWLARAAGRGEAILARTAGEQVQGRFVDLGADGALVIELADGSVRHILAADVFPADRGKGG